MFGGSNTPEVQGQGRIIYPIDLSLYSEGMALFLEITIGTSAGKRFKLMPGLRLGRTSGEVLIDDPKASGLHALIEQEPDGTYFIRDLDSTNGTKINDLKSGRGRLVAGTRIQIGRTYLTVSDDSAAPILVPIKTAPAAAKVAPELTWEGKINSHLSTLPLQNVPTERNLKPFKQTLQLHFIEGLQAQTLITLGYGPRLAGSTQKDIRLLDPDAPEIAFKIECGTHDEPIFSTPAPSVVFLNGLELPEHYLYSGDLIRIGKTLIKVDFL